jgi:hypothetical protein
MKTILDAVNEFKAVWPEKSYNTTWVSKHDSDEAFKFGSIVTDDTVCTVEEFNALVSDLENWQPTLSASPYFDLTYAEYKASFERVCESFNNRKVTHEPIISTEGPIRGKMTIEPESKPKLAAVSGMQYELGKLYEFSDSKDFSDSIVETLEATHPEGNGKKFETNRTYWSYCREFDRELLGTITPAPVDLVDGAVYEFVTKFGKYCGFYLKCGERFTIHPDGTYVLRSDTLITTRLVPEVKS